MPLNSKQRKRLRKILQIKEQKAKHKCLVQKLEAASLSKAEQNLLTCSTSVFRGRVTRKEIKEQVQRSSNLPGSDGRVHNWKRKHKNRRKLRIEKVLSEPKPEIKVCFDNEEETSEQESDEELEISMTSQVISEACSENDTGKEEESLLGENITSVQRDEPVVTDTTGSGSGIVKVEGPTDDQQKMINGIPVQNVPVYRTKEIQDSRLALPILSEEHMVMDAIRGNDVVLVCGETGSGKSTQVPQFLYEAGYAHTQEKRIIGVTEPRRVAAVTVSLRVAEEMNLSSREVSYQIRYDGCVGEDTRIKFMTDGVLLKEIEQDFLLLKYSVIVLDEAHERSVFTDILVGLLSRIVPQRRKVLDPLKLVIMSATLRVDDFISNQMLYPVPPPVVTVESRQFPVTVHFNRHTPTDYLTAVYRKVCKIHRELPEGHILVFLTGKAEILSICSKLKKTFCKEGDSSLNNKSSRRRKKSEDNAGSDDDEDVRSWIRKTKQDRRSSFRNSSRTGSKAEKDTPINLDSYPVLPSMNNIVHWSDEEMDVDLIEEDEMGGAYPESDSKDDPLLIYPLYSMLSPEKQSEVFRPRSDGVRVCIVATNVAETSITIPGVKYVVDSGKVKKKYYDKLTGASMFMISWISKASANQRAGRAGRTTPGHCYRLYSSSMYQHELPDHTPPEITDRPVSDLVLQMKAMNIHKVVNFPFPTPPSPEALQAAEKLLVQLGALDGETLKATPLGLTMSQFPIAPRYSKMLCLSNQHGCLPYMVTMVSALSVPELFMSDSEKVNVTRRSWAGQGECYLLGDLMVSLRAICAYECSKNKELFCQQNGLRSKAILEIRKQRQQLTNIINAVCMDTDCAIDPKLAPPTQQQAKMLRQIVLAGHGDHVARKISIIGLSTEDKKRFKYAYQTPLSEAPVYLHTSSVLRASCPEYVVFQELIQTSKLFLREVTAIEEKWLPIVVPELCTFSSPLDTPPPHYDSISDTIRCHMTCSFGPWNLSAHDLPFPDVIEKYKYFAKFLLEGKVIKELSQFCESLLSPPITMIKPWAKLQKKTEVILSSLIAKKVSCKQSLIHVWTNDDPKFLLAAYSMWLPQLLHTSLLELWPPIGDGLKHH